MKVVLYMTLTASGQLTEADADFTIPAEIGQNAYRHAKEAGNVVAGRRTYEQLRERGAWPLDGMEVVVVSRSLGPTEHVSVAASPREAIEILDRKGFQTVFLGGGATLYSSFLGEGLVDEIFLNVAPLARGDGLRIAFDSKTRLRFRSLGATNLGTDIVQLHYRADRE